MNELLIPSTAASVLPKRRYRPSAPSWAKIPPQEQTPDKSGVVTHGVILAARNGQQSLPAVPFPRSDLRTYGRNAPDPQICFSVPCCDYRVVPRPPASHFAEFAELRHRS